MKIEFSGMPRAGKTTIIELLKTNFSYPVIHHEEKFELVPYNSQDLFEYNLWYANFCVTRLLSIKDEEKINIFDRGIFDRIVFGIALYKFGKISKNQLNIYLKILTPYLKLMDFTFIFNISPQLSFSRIKKLNINNITHNLDFLGVLYETYDKLGKSQEKICILGDNDNLNEIKNKVLGLL